MTPKKPTPRRKKRQDKIFQKRYESMFDQQLFTRSIPPFLIEIVNNQIVEIKGKLGTISGITKLIDNSFKNYQYKGAIPSVPKHVGIQVGLFQLTPVFVSKKEIQAREGSDSIYTSTGYEVAYMKDSNGIVHPIFEVDDQFKKKVHKIVGNKDFFYFDVNSIPSYWKTNNFDSMNEKVYIFICTTRQYIPCIENGIHSAHMWLTTVALDKQNNGITNIFDTNSTSLYNFQYARGIEILTKLPVLTPGKTQKVYFLNCQNDYYSDADPNEEPCIGLQNREKWGLCQTFSLLMYLVVLHNPMLAIENLDEIIRRPGIDRLIYKLKDLTSIGKLMVSISEKYDMELTPS